MSLQVEKLENNMARLTIEVAAEELEKAIESAYQKNKGKISLPGFRKGKAPRRMLEQMYGKEIFYEDAANELIPDAYEAAYDECGEEIVSSPKIDVVQLEAGKPFIFPAEVALKPEAVLGQYKGIKVDKVDAEVTEEEITAEIDREREKNSRTVDVTDRAIREGDIATIDFEGFVDGEAFEGGKGSDYPLTIGSHTFIPGFEEELIGAEAGQEKEVNVTFPEDYQAAELAGKPAVFKCLVKRLQEKQLPELDDDFVGEVSEESDTVEEYRTEIRNKLADRKTTEAKNAKEEAVIDAIIANAQFTGMTREMLLEQVKPQVLKRIQSRLVLEAVAEAENIEVTEEEVNEELKKMGEAYQMEIDKVEEFLGENGRTQVKEDIRVRKAAELVVENAVEE